MSRAAAGIGLPLRRASFSAWGRLFYFFLAFFAFLGAAALAFLAFFAMLCSSVVEALTASGMEIEP